MTSNDRLCECGRALFGACLGRCYGYPELGGVLTVEQSLERYRLVNSPDYVPAPRVTRFGDIRVCVSGEGYNEQQALADLRSVVGEIRSDEEQSWLYLAQILSLLPAHLFKKSEHPFTDEERSKR